MPQASPQTTRVETEINIGWAAANPQLFEKVFNNFFEVYSANYLIASEVRKGYLTLIAVLERGEHA